MLSYNTVQTDVPIVVIKAVVDAAGIINITYLSLFVESKFIARLSRQIMKPMTMLSPTDVIVISSIS